MKVVIWAGGAGTRLMEETHARPKPLIEIGGRPVLWHVMKGYAQAGVRDFVICLGYKGDAIRRYFLDFHLFNADFEVALDSGAVTTLTADDEHGWRVVLAETGATTGTGGRLKRVERYITDDVFLCTYGDSLSDVSIPDVVAYHHRMGKVATMCVMRSGQRFGVVEVGDGLVTKFAEKPPLGDALINGGYYVFNRRVFDYLDHESAFEGDPLQRLVADGQLAAYEHAGSHRAMDTARDVVALNEEWNSGAPSWKTW
jgi:glucose-1-phosphate cytidylyltransferase